MQTECVCIYRVGVSRKLEFSSNPWCQVPEESIFTWSGNLINDLSQHIDIPIIRKAGIFGKSSKKYNRNERK